MMTVKGIYDNGIVTFKEPLAVPEPSEVLVSFTPQPEITNKKQFDPHSESFVKARILLKPLKTSLSEAIIDERRNAL